MQDGPSGGIRNKWNHHWDQITLKCNGRWEIELRVQFIKFERASDRGSLAL